MSSKVAAYKKSERENWNKFSARYTKVTLPEFRPFGRRLIAMAGVRKGMWVLDVATGPGEPALTIARRVGPDGLVLGIDFSPAMIRLARARAKRAGARNVHFREMDAERPALGAIRPSSRPSTISIVSAISTTEAALANAGSASAGWR